MSWTFEIRTSFSHCAGARLSRASSATSYIPHMVKPPKFTPQTWQDQQRLLAEGARSQAVWGGLKGAAILLGLGVGALAWLALLVYVIGDLFF